MRVPFRTTWGPIAITVDGRSINAVQLSRLGDGWQVEAATTVRRATSTGPLGRADIDRLSGVLERKGFQGNRVVLSVANDQLLTAVLDLPPLSSGAPLDQIACGELAAAHKCMPDELTATYWEIPQPNPNTDATRVMAVGCRNNHTNTVLDLFEAARFSVLAIDTQACAIARALRTLTKERDALTVALDIEWMDATLFMVCGENIVFERRFVDSGLCRLHSNLVEQIDLDGDVADYLLTEAGLCDAQGDRTQEALRNAVREQIDSYVQRLSSELRLTLTYVLQEHGQRGMDELLILGEGAAIPDLAEDLGESCGLPATVVTPLQLGRCRQTLIRECQSPVLTQTFGLAQYPTGGRR
ncbi:MAG: pilus assembly protein PilM [Phycisphaerales bacterium]|nr:pilus assembly protein PilM [Phycisphaerae bacterium]NNF44186.1 pilus assembly protein PilM [Phycisphaerales bacterium]NNM24452.1 pilus assembly protein PilM [Phycisphaerales bacterium]